MFRDVTSPPNWLSRRVSRKAESLFDEKDKWNLHVRAGTSEYWRHERAIEPGSIVSAGTILGDKNPKRLKAQLKVPRYRS